jgi:hypothetical protein
MLVACYFDSDGVLLRVEERRQKAAPAPDPDRDALYLDILRQFNRDFPNIPPRYLEALAWANPPVRQAWQWTEHLGVEFGPVWVRRFVLPGKRIGIEDGNRLYEDREPEEGGGTLEEWLADGSFVFWWSRDLWVGADGRVFAT